MQIGSSKNMNSQSRINSKDKSLRLSTASKMKMKTSRENMENLKGDTEYFINNLLKTSKT